MFDAEFVNENREKSTGRAPSKKSDSEEKFVKEEKIERKHQICFEKPINRSEIERLQLIVYMRSISRGEIRKI